MEDSAIIELYFRREEAAVRETEKAYGNRLLALARRILENREDAEESVSDTYLAAWRTIPPTKRVFFFAYLAKICRFSAFGILDRRKADKRSAVVVELSEELALCIPDTRREAEAEGRELAKLLNRFLAEQDPESRRIFLRRYWFGDSVADIAGRYAISGSKVKSRLFRTRNQLRDFLKGEGITV